MLAQSLGLIATGALGASAFMIPAGIVQAGEALESVQVFDPKHQIYRLPCSSCAFPTSSVVEESVKEDEAMEFWIQGGANHLVLNFTVTDDQTLELNGQKLYPRPNDLLSGSRTIMQVPASASLQDIENGDARHADLEITGTGMGWSEENIITDAGDALVEISYSIWALEQQAMQLNHVYIEVLRTAEGELLITDIHDKDLGLPLIRLPGKKVDDAPAHNVAQDAKDCGPFTLCGFKASFKAFEDKLQAMRGPRPAGRPGCGKGRRPHNGMLPTHRRPGFLHPEGKEDGIPSFHGMRPHHHDANRPHHGHHGRHHHSFFHSFMRGVHFILIPTLIGVACGMFASVVGLIAGHLVSYVWIRFVRGGRPGYQSVSLDDTAAVEEAAAADDEKIVYEVATEEETLPVYEDAPAYEVEADAKTEQ